MKNLLQIIVLFLSLDAVAQIALEDRLHDMQIDPRLKEKVYVHTNKTSYLSDEAIWFKAYVGDSINFPSIQTRTLDIRLFDDQGEHIFSNKVPIENGIGSGQFELNNSVVPGTYFLQARTNYMRNYGEDYQYLQEITVLGEKSPRTTTEKIYYDVQLFPEGGRLIEEIENIVGIKALLNGRSLDYSGTIINEQGTTVMSFQSEHLGMGKCSFFYNKGEKYRARIKLRDTVLELEVPQALSEGITLSVDTSDDNNLNVYLKTNEQTFYNQVYSNYKLLFRQDRQIFGLVSVDRLDSLTASIKTTKSIFLDGVHTVTLFADDKPIAERKFYIETDRKKTSVSLKQQTLDTDSIAYRLDLKGGKKGLRADLSVSVLPASSKTRDQKNSIQSAFLLKPFVKGHVENPAYYFDVENKKRKEHLDLLLLTQGWSRYNLDDLMKEINPDEKYRFEKGFELKGSLKEETKYKNLVLIPDNLQIVDKIKLEGRSNFVFQDLKVFKGDTVRVAYQNWLGKITKPSAIQYDSIITEDIPNLNIPMLYEYSKAQEKLSVGTAKEYDHAITDITDEPISNPDGTIELEEVVVAEKRRRDRYFERRKVIEKYKPIVKDIGKYYDIPIPELATKYNISLIDFLGREGYKLETQDYFQYYLRDFSGFAYLSINGRFIQPEELHSSVQLQMKDVAHVMVSRTRKPDDPRVRITLFQVFTSKITTDLYDKHIIRNGYDRPKKYYAPLYDFDQERPIAFSEIDWKPQLKTNKNGTVFFKIAKNKSIEPYLFSIQGFSEEGHLISELIVE